MHPSFPLPSCPFIAPLFFPFFRSLFFFFLFSCCFLGTKINHRNTIERGGVGRREVEKRMSGPFPATRFDPSPLFEKEVRDGEEGYVHLRIQKRSGRKSLTIVQGLNKGPSGKDFEEAEEEALLQRDHHRGREVRCRITAARGSEGGREELSLREENRTHGVHQGAWVLE